MCEPYLTSFSHPYFVDENTNKIYLHPILTESGECYEKREFKKLNRDAKYIDNKKLKKQIDNFLTLNPLYKSLVYYSGKTFIERIIDVIEGRKHEGRKNINSLKKAKYYSLSEINETVYLEGFLIEHIFKMEFENIVYVLNNLMNDDLKNYSGLLLWHCIDKLREDVFNHILSLEKDLPYNFEKNEKSLLFLAISKSEYFYKKIVEFGEIRFGNELYKNNAIYQAITLKENEIVKYLLSKDVELRREGKTNALMFAFWSGNYQIIKMIYEKDVSLILDKFEIPFEDALAYNHDFKTILKVAELIGLDKNVLLKLLNSNYVIAYRKLAEWGYKRFLKI